MFRVMTTGDGFQIFYNILYFHPETWGNDPTFDTYFSNGCFNHHLTRQVLTKTGNLHLFFLAVYSCLKTVEQKSPFAI